MKTEEIISLKLSLGQKVEIIYRKNRAGVLESRMGYFSIFEKNPSWSGPPFPPLIEMIYSLNDNILNHPDNEKESYNIRDIEKITPLEVVTAQHQ